MDRPNKMLTALAAVATAGAIAAGAALATPGSGVLGAPILARGTLDGHFKLKLHKSSNQGDVAVQQVTLAPGGSTGWHTHPGPAVVIVKSGSFTLYDADDDTCTGTPYSAGQVFVDSGYGHVHIGRNEGATNTELYVTYLDVPAGAAPRIDAPDPGLCTF
jgi:quercetin dioxygenase-like cupin family protein